MPPVRKQFLVTTEKRVPKKGDLRIGAGTGGRPNHTLDGPGIFGPENADWRTHDWATRCDVVVDITDVPTSKTPIVPALKTEKRYPKKGDQYVDSFGDLRTAKFDFVNQKYNVLVVAES